MNRYSKCLTAALVAATVAVPAVADAKPHPYAKGDALTAMTVGKAMNSNRLHMVPVRGADGTNMLCRSNSKARRIAGC